MDVPLSCARIKHRKRDPIIRHCTVSRSRPKITPNTQWRDTTMEDTVGTPIAPDPPDHVHLVTSASAPKHSSEEQFSTCSKPDGASHTPMRLKPRRDHDAFLQRQSAPHFETPSRGKTSDIGRPTAGVMQTSALLWHGQLSVLTAAAPDCAWRAFLDKARRDERNVATSSRAKKLLVGKQLSRYRILRRRA